MFVGDLLFALFFAILLSIIFVVGLRRTGPWANFLVFFIIVFLAAWAGGVWLTPVGPPLWGVYWVPFLVIGLIFALFLAASAPARPPRYRTEADRQAEAQAVTEAAFGVFLWILLLILCFVIFAYYLRCVTAGASDACVKMCGEYTVTDL